MKSVNILRKSFCSSFAYNLVVVALVAVKQIGDYDHLGMAYKSLFDYANDNNLDYTAPIIEFYDKSMGHTLKGNPDKYETRIYLPIKK